MHAGIISAPIHVDHASVDATPIIGSCPIFFQLEVFAADTFARPIVGWTLISRRTCTSHACLPEHLEGAFVVMGRDIQQNMPVRQRLQMDKPGTLPGLEPGFF